MQRLQAKMAVEWSKFTTIPIWGIWYLMGNLHFQKSLMTNELF